MKIIITACCIVMLLAAAGQARDVFTDKNLSELQIVEIGDDTVLLKDQAGIREEVIVGDRLGSELAAVVELGKTSITVEANGMRITIPPPFSFER
jgi:hypothetical protein